MNTRDKSLDKAYEQAKHYCQGPKDNKYFIKEKKMKLKTVTSSSL